jgi:L-amino acid N-acyltransferase YncA
VSALSIRPATRLDADRVAEIYNHYVLRTVVTFEEEAVAGAEMAARIERIAATHAWLVCEEPDTRIVGYAYAAAWHSRCAYRLTTETTVYVAPDRHRLGVGTALYSALLATLRKQKFHCAIGAIALPNEGSVVLHERFGFGKVGQFAAVGFKLGRWIDVGYWQLML